MSLPTIPGILCAATGSKHILSQFSLASHGPSAHSSPQSHRATGHWRPMPLLKHVNRQQPMSRLATQVQQLTAALIQPAGPAPTPAPLPAAPAPAPTSKPCVGTSECYATEPEGCNALFTNCSIQISLQPCTELAMMAFTINHLIVCHYKPRSVLYFLRRNYT